MQSGATEDPHKNLEVTSEEAVSVLTDTQLPVLLLNNSVPFPEARREMEVLNSGFVAESNPALTGRKAEREALPSASLRPVSLGCQLRAFHSFPLQTFLSHSLELSTSLHTYHISKEIC